jgi:hypothetical protein
MRAPLYDLLIFLYQGAAVPRPKHKATRQKAGTPVLATAAVMRSTTLFACEMQSFAFASFTGHRKYRRPPDGLGLLAHSRGSWLAIGCLILSLWPSETKVKPQHVLLLLGPHRHGRTGLARATCWCSTLCPKELAAAQSSLHGWLGYAHGQATCKPEPDAAPLSDLRYPEIFTSTQRVRSSYRRAREATALRGRGRPPPRG